MQIKMFLYKSSLFQIDKTGPEYSINKQITLQCN